MTISYSKDISNGSGFWTFFKVLIRWKGSLYRLLYLDLIGYLILYYIINFTYRFALQTPSQKKTFVKIVMFCDHMKSNIPASFLLGFFVAGVMARWLKMFLCIPRLDKMAFLFEGFMNGGDKEMCRKLRQTAMRFLNLSWILCLKELSDQIKDRFTKNNNLINKEYDIREALSNLNRDRKVQSTFRKIITDAEIRAFEGITTHCESKFKKKYVPEYWIPLQWASRLLQKAYVHGFIFDSRTLNSMISDIDGLRNQMHTLQICSAIMIPLVYTQVITIAVYSYFLCQIFASQFIESSNKIEGHEVDMYIPVFAIFQFLFFMGWLKVALCVMNPFGDDDEDFPTSDILDENLDVTFRSVTADYSMYPETLDAPGIHYESQRTYHEDLLASFMEEIDGDLEEIDVTNDDADVTALEVKTDYFKGFLKKITCGFCKVFRRNQTSSTIDISTSPNMNRRLFVAQQSLYSDTKRSSTINSSIQCSLDQQSSRQRDMSIQYI